MDASAVNAAGRKRAFPKSFNPPSLQLLLTFPTKHLQLPLSARHTRRKNVFNPHREAGFGKNLRFFPPSRAATKTAMTHPVEEKGKVTFNKSSSYKQHQDICHFSSKL